MIRTNLSTRPFYNERAVHVFAAAIALVVLAITAWQIVTVVRLSRYKTELNAAIRRDQNEATYRAAEAQQTRRGLDQKELTLVAGAAKEANDLIAQRTFSWTQLFNQLESTLPENVMITSVRPEIEDGVTTIHLDIQGKTSEQIDEFWDRLEKTGSFKDVGWSNVDVTDQGFHRIAMRARYTPAEARQ